MMTAVGTLLWILEAHVIPLCAGIFASDRDEAVVEILGLKLVENLGRRVRGLIRPASDGGAGKSEGGGESGERHFSWIGDFLLFFLEKSFCNLLF